MEAAIRRLRGEDEEFFRKRGDLMERIGPGPDAVTADLETTGKALLNAPWELGAEVLGWFARNPILSVPRPSPPTC